MNRGNCLLIILDFQRESLYDSYSVYSYMDDVRLVSEPHDTAASMWRRVDELWAAFPQSPDAPKIGMCFLLQNWKEQMLQVAVTDYGYYFALNPMTDYTQNFYVPIPDDGTRVTIWVPSEMICTRQDLHSRANLEQIVECWMDGNHIPAYIPMNFQFPQEIERIPVPPDPDAT